MMDIAYAARGVLSAEPRELTYFSNAPTVLFAALFVWGLGAQKFVTSSFGRGFLIFIFCAVATIFICLPVAMTAQRASLGYAALYIVVMAALSFARAPYRMAGMVALSVLALLPFVPAFAEVIDVLLQKTRLVGFNARAQEFSAVWDTVTSSPWSVLFGMGWGGTFESPAVAGIRVNYTHSLLSSLILKTGIAGLLLGGTYLLGLSRLLWRGMRQNPVLGFALAGPFLIDVLFYASFKSFDFGLILLLISALPRKDRSVA
jgi:hypothetical protein